MESVWEIVIITTVIFLVLQIIAFIKHKRNINIIRFDYEINGVIFHKDWIVYIFIWLYLVVVGFILFVEYEGIYFMVPLFGLFAYLKKVSRSLNGNNDLPNYLDHTFYSHVSKIPQLNNVSIKLDNIKEIKVRGLFWVKGIEIYDTDKSIFIPIYTKNFATLIDILVKNVEVTIYKEVIDDLRLNYRFDKWIQNIWKI